MTYNRAIRMVYTSFESTFSELSNECLSAKLGVDTAENEPVSMTDYK